MNECIKNKGLDVRQGRRMAHDRSIWRGFKGGGKCVRCCPGMNEILVVNCHSYMKGGSLPVAKPTS